MDSKDECFIIPVILCGGSGTRLWPMSRQTYPKQFLKCNPDTKRTFLQDTQLRLKNFNDLSNPIIICNFEHRFIVAEQMREIDITPKAIILEPEGKNTCPAATVAAIKSLKIHPNPFLLLLPADHSIKDEKNFKNSIKKGITYAKKNKIVTFGISPTNPETGYGYIEAEKELDYKNILGSEIKKFIEKPEFEIAKSFIKDKKYSWNSGIYLARAEILIKEVKQFEPLIYSSCYQALNENIYDLTFQRLCNKTFKNCQNISLDNAIMEKTNLGYVIPLSAKWSDIGSWNSIWELSKKDSQGNSLNGNIMIDETKKCYIKSDHRLIVGLGLENLVIVDTKDALLISKRSESEKVKSMVSNLINKNLKEAKYQKKVFRPWGNYTSIADGINWQVKKINVKPKASLSLQKHKYRAEHWIVVSGVASIEVGEEKKVLNKNESTFIPLGFKHRLSNEGEELLTIIEVQSGSYLGEDDIIRFEDNYGRKHI